MIPLLIGALAGIAAGWALRTFTARDRRRKVYRDGQRCPCQPSPQAARAATAPPADTPDQGLTAVIPTLVSPAAGLPQPFWMPPRDRSSA